MANVVFALEHLLAGVRRVFADDELDVPNLFGWREKAKKDTTGTRIVWVPGDDLSGDVGTLGPARHVGRNPRPLATLNEIATVYLVAFDKSRPEDEASQYHAARLLFDAWYRAAHRVAYGTFQIVRTQWLVSTRERRAGATLRVTLSIQAAILDHPVGTIPGGELGAEIGLALNAELDPQGPVTLIPESE